MSYNQKMLSLVTLIVAAVTAAVAFVVFNPPFSANFKIEVAFLILSEILAGAAFVAKFGSRDSVFPFAVGLLPVNLLYVAFTLALAIFADEWRTPTFFMCHVVGFAATVIVGIVFKMGERQIEEQSKDDPPPQKIERAAVTWR